MGYKKIFILILILVPVFFWGIKFAKQKDAEKDKGPAVNSVPEPAASEFFITVDEVGEFNPRHIRIKRGDKVTWLNKSSAPVWPAVGPHPTHDAYPEFDSRQKVSPGENWSLIFQRLGMWQYHNHLRGGSMVGIVEVLDETPQR